MMGASRGTAPGARPGCWRCGAVVRWRTAGLCLAGRRAGGSAGCVGALSVSGRVVETVLWSGRSGAQLKRPAAAGFTLLVLSVRRTEW
jgi:hypothetical protein